LESNLRVMRAACRKFIEAGGPNGEDFFANGHHHHTANLFGLALGDLRSSIGYQPRVILRNYRMQTKLSWRRFCPRKTDSLWRRDW